MRRIGSLIQGLDANKVRMEGETAKIAFSSCCWTLVSKKGYQVYEINCLVSDFLTLIARSDTTV